MIAALDEVVVDVVDTAGCCYGQATEPYLFVAYELVLGHMNEALRERTGVNLVAGETSCCAVELAPFPVLTSRHAETANLGVEAGAAVFDLFDALVEMVVAAGSAASMTYPQLHQHLVAV